MKRCILYYSETNQINITIFTNQLDKCLTKGYNTKWDIHGRQYALSKLKLQISFYPVGEGNGNPLQYSCLENSLDGGAWWATVHWVTKSQTWLKWLSSSREEVNNAELETNKGLYTRAYIFIHVCMYILCIYTKH